jgi:hypothetical protein
MPQCNDPRCDCNKPRGPTAEDKLAAIAAVLEKYEWADYERPDLFGETNVDDVYDRGIAQGEAILATKLRDML